MIHLGWTPPQKLIYFFACIYFCIHHITFHTYSNMLRERLYNARFSKHKLSKGGYIKRNMSHIWQPQKSLLVSLLYWISTRTKINIYKNHLESNYDFECGIYLHISSLPESRHKNETKITTLIHDSFSNRDMKNTFT